MIDVCSDSDTIGKPSGSDVAQGKRTLMVIHALSQEDQPAKQALLSALGKGDEATQESVSKAMIKYLGLDWDNQVLNFHKNKRRVNTISALQVREKTYTKSINLWKKYKEELSELYEITTKTNLKS